MDINFLWQYVPSLLQGVLTTLALMVSALTIGLCFALFLTACSYTHSKILNFFIYLYTFFIRGTPLLVQIFLIYYGSSQFILLRESFL